MWVLYAFGSAVFAGLTSILAKCGIRKTDSNVATAVRTIVVLIMSAVMVLLVGSERTIIQIAPKTWLFLVLSGLATGASWLCYFRALQLGDVNKVVPIDKSSTILTMLLAFLFLKERITLVSALCIPVIGIGTFLMIQKKENGTGGQERKEADRRLPLKAGRGLWRERLYANRWLIYACLSAVFAALTSILGKIGIDGVESNLGTMIRTAVVLVMAWLLVAVTGKLNRVRQMPGRELLFICLSGLATGASWLCYYRALQDGPASVVAPIDKLSILVTVVFSYIVFREKLSGRVFLGLLMITAGTLGLLIGV